MCGFLAEYNPISKELTDALIFKGLLSLSMHRGPDSSGIHRGENYQLGFNRLAILDLSKQGNQPKASPSKRFVVVFNGEIYNYNRLADKYNLKALKSTSDTEVLVHLLDVIGVEQTIKNLNGMFAISIMDTVENRLYLTRDFAGIKPLFYGISNKGLVAASQFDQVYKHNWLKPNLKFRKALVKEYFGFGYMQAPNTIYESIFQVEPGVLLCVDAKLNLNSITIAKFPNSCSDIHFEENEDLEALLSNVVKDQLVSDVPIGTFLSGGIDSPLVAAFAKANKDDIQAFSLKVDDPKLNESDIAKIYANHLNINQRLVRITESDLISQVDEHFYAFQEPFGDFSSIPTYAITKKAREEHKVMLSGDGGDEIFFGYPRFLDILNKSIWFRLPFWMRKPLVSLTNKTGITNTWAPQFKNLRSMVMNKHCHVPFTVLDEAFVDTKFSKEMNVLYDVPNSSKTELQHALRHNEFYAHLQRVLIKVDRASMANGMEVRVPLLDKRIISFGWKLKQQLKSVEDLKRPLKSILSKKVPEQLINSKKMGFSVPLHHWLHNQLKQDVQHFVFERDFYAAEIMKSSVLKQYVIDFYKQKHNNFWGVWHIYAWQKWADIYQ